MDLENNLRHIIGNQKQRAKSVSETDAYKELMKWKKPINPSRPAAPEPAQPANPIPASINSVSDYWSIDGVQYRNGIHTVDLSKSLLDGDSAKTQDQWVAHYNDAKGKNEFHAPDFPLLYGIVRALHTARDNASVKTEIDEAKKFLFDKSRAHWLMTLTRVRYKPSGTDLIIHNYGTPDKYESTTDFIGLDEYITATKQPLAYQKLLGTVDNTQQIHDVFKWLNGTDTYLWRVNSHPDSSIDRVARFSADSGRADLYCNGDPTISNLALGVRVAKKI